MVCGDNHPPNTVWPDLRGLIVKVSTGMVAVAGASLRCRQPRKEAFTHFRTYATLCERHLSSPQSTV